MGNTSCCRELDERIEFPRGERKKRNESVFLTSGNDGQLSQSTMSRSIFDVSRAAKEVLHNSTGIYTTTPESGELHRFVELCVWLPKWLELEFNSRAMPNTS